MTKKTRAKSKLKGRARLRAEIVEMKQGLHKLGMVAPGTPCIRLTAEESLKMAHAILNPREPSARIIAAAKEYLAAQSRV